VNRCVSTLLENHGVAVYAHYSDATKACFVKGTPAQNVRFDFSKLVRVVAVRNLDDGPVPALAAAAAAPAAVLAPADAAANAQAAPLVPPPPESGLAAVAAGTLTSVMAQLVDSVLTATPLARLGQVVALLAVYLVLLLGLCGGGIIDGLVGRCFPAPVAAAVRRRWAGLRRFTAWLVGPPPAYFSSVAGSFGAALLQRTCDLLGISVTLQPVVIAVLWFVVLLFTKSPPPPPRGGEAPAAAFARIRAWMARALARIAFWTQLDEPAADGNSP
jgi:hypothetical protein